MIAYIFEYRKKRGMKMVNEQISIGTQNRSNRGRKSGRRILCLILALVFSSAFTWAPVLKTVSAGLAIVICTAAAAGICAVLFPVEEETAV